MNKYRVEIPYVVWLQVDIEADTPEEAEQQAVCEHGGLSAYVGNGGTDKLVGTSGGNCSVYADDEPLDTPTIKTTVEEERDE